MVQFCDANGFVQHVVDEGPPDAPTLVFANSLGTDLRIWDDVVPGLRRDFRIIRYDKRGHGLSGLPPDVPAIADYAADLAALLDTLGVVRATFVGLSIGGLIVQALASRRPDLVAAFVFCDTAHKIGTPEMWAARIAAVEQNGIASIADPVLERWFSAGYRRTRPVALAGWRAMLTRTPVDGYLAACRALRDADLTNVAQNLHWRTLCVVGDEDGSTPVDVVRAFADLIPAARFEIVRGAGHLPCIEAPDMLRDLILSHAGGAP